MGNARGIWVVRHCEPVKGGAGVCLGRRSDPPLSEAGMAHARELAERFDSADLDQVHCSPLLRSIQTAACLGEHQVVPDLTEQDHGSWDGMAWPDIKERFPELYAARADDNSLVPPDAEPCDAAADRYERALLATQGDCLAVVHKGALSALLCRLLDVSPKRMWRIAVPYGCCMLLKERNGRLDALPSEEEAASLFEQCGTPERVILHCRAVAELACEIAGDLSSCGVDVSQKLVHAAAMLHDIARTQPDHPACGARFLERRGYPHVAAIVAGHHDACQEVQPLDEAAVVFLADKLVCGTERVSIEERFARSAQACKTEEARAKHAALLATAERIAGEVLRVTGKRR